MRELTSLELGAVVAELRPRIANSFLKKFYDLGDNAFRMSFHGPEGNTEVYCRLLNALNETGFKEEVGEATNFARAVRKRIEDSKLLDVRQHGSDRIVIFEFGARGGRYSLVIEMFGKGNLVVIKDGRIEVCYRILEYKDRNVKPGFEYVPPKSESTGLDSLDSGNVQAILEKVSKSGGKTITELSKYLNIGPLYLEDAITSARLDPKAKLESGSIDALLRSIMSLIGKARKPDPVIYKRDGTLIDYSIFPLEKYRGLEIQRCASVNGMLDAATLEGRSSRKVDSVADETEEIEAAIAKQKELSAKFIADSEDYARFGKAIFERMGEINALIIRIREVKKPTLEELRMEFTDLGIQEISLKDRTVTIEI